VPSGFGWNGVNVIAAHITPNAAIDSVMASVRSRGQLSGSEA